MKILIVGEGPSEGVRKESPSEWVGALPALVQKIAKVEFSHDLKKISDRAVPRLHGTGNGYFKRSLEWMREAQKSGYDAIVLVVDQDDKQERVREVKRAQEDMTIATIRRALGVAIHKFDAWILADEKALSKVLQVTVQTLPAPEENPDPKETCKQLLDEHQSTLGLANLYAAVAEQIQVDTLEKKCPRGFAPFAKRVRACLGPQA